MKTRQRIVVIVQYLDKDGKLNEYSYKTVFETKAVSVAEAINAAIEEVRAVASGQRDDYFKAFDWIVRVTGAYLQRGDYGADS